MKGTGKAVQALGIVFSDIHEWNMGDLTSNRTVAAIPFAGRYWLIDFVLSNMINSGIYKVGVITKSNYQPLMEHIGSGKDWDLSRKNGGIAILPPYGGSIAIPPFLRDKSQSLPEPICPING